MGVDEKNHAYRYSEYDLPPILVPQVKLESIHFSFFNSGTLPALEDYNSKNCVA